MWSYAYWISTILVSLMVAVSAATYLFHPATIDGVRELGFPDYFRFQLAVLKGVACVVLAAPIFPAQVKEWAYAGVGFFLLTAIVAHTAHGDPPVLSLVSVFFFGLLVLSNISLRMM